MPRPARRTRAVVRTKEPEAASASTTATADQMTTETNATNTSPPAPARRTRRSNAASGSQTPSAGSRRTSSRHAAVASAATSTSATASASAKPKAATRLARGSDTSGLDIMDDTFADIDTNFGDHTLGDLSDLGNLDDLDADLDAFGGSPGAAAPTADTTAASSSSFNVGLFRRGRPRQSSVHSRDDAPIRPSSRSGNSSAATPSMGSSFSLGTFKRRAREPSILGRHRRIRDESRGPSRDPSREPSRMHSRHMSRNPGADSGSELDDTAVTAPQYMSDAESSSLSNARGRASRTTGSRVAQAAQAAQTADTSVSSSANTTTMLLMGRARTRAAAAPKAPTTTTSRKRKSQEGQRENEVPKRRSRGVETAEVEEAAMGDVVDAVEPLSDISIVPSVEAPEPADVADAADAADVEDAVTTAGLASSPLSSPASSPASARLSETELRRRYTTPGGPNDEIMAPPMSSDSESETPPMWPTLKGLAKGVRRGRTAVAPSVPTLSRQTPDLVDDEIASDISSPPSLTHSPNYPTAPAKKPAARGRTAPARGQAQKEVAPLTTAALAALLPQRHRRARSTHRSGSHDNDAEDDELERSALLSEDDDELAHHARSFSGASLRRGRSAAGLRATAQAQAQAQASGKTADDRNKEKKRRRTYGSRGVSGMSDKENQDNSNSAEDGGADDSTFTPQAGDTLGDDDTTQVLPPAPTRTARSFGEELEKAAIKFKEVDQWSLEYESVTRSSSPDDAR